LRVGLPAHDLPVADVHDPRGGHVQVDAAAPPAGDPLSEHEDAVVNPTKLLRERLEHRPVGSDLVAPPMPHALVAAVAPSLHGGAKGNDLDVRIEVLELRLDVATTAGRPRLSN